MTFTSKLLKERQQHGRKNKLLITLRYPETTDTRKTLHPTLILKHKTNLPQPKAALLHTHCEHDNISVQTTSFYP